MTSALRMGTSDPKPAGSLWRPKCLPPSAPPPPPPKKKEKEKQLPAPPRRNKHQTKKEQKTTRVPFAPVRTPKLVGVPAQIQPKPCSSGPEQIFLQTHSCHQANITPVALTYFCGGLGVFLRFDAVVAGLWRFDCLLLRCLLVRALGK